jgi:hypothetical protein
MSVWLHGILLFLICGTFLEGGERYVLKDSDPWDTSLAEFSFEDVNMRPLFEKARRRYPSLSESELAPRIRMNMRYIFYNRLNRNRFLVAPSPESFIQQISTIFDLSEELQQLMGRGRRLLMEEPQPGRYNRLAREVRKKAGQLKRSFQDFFVEGSYSRYVLEYPKAQPASAKFTHFILQSEKINKVLAERLDDFFFGASPGAVSLDAYRRSSILVLSESLCRLSRLAEEEIAATD